MSALDSPSLRMQRLRELVQQIAALSSDALELLEAYVWPGNVCELRRVIQGAVQLGTEDTLSAALRPERMPPPSGPRVEPLAPAAPTGNHDVRYEYERNRILGALEKCAGNQTLAARLLGISRRTLLNHLDAHGIPRPRKVALGAG